MEEQAYIDFLDFAGESSNLVEDLNNFLLSNDCKREIKIAKSGFTVSYFLHGAERTLATFVCRKTGIKLRIYPQRLSEYNDFLSALPAVMKKEIIKSSVCKRLINPADCNPRCIMGYDFILDDERYKKCRYMAFMHTVTAESQPYIKAFLQKEI